MVTKIITRVRKLIVLGFIFLSTAANATTDPPVVTSLTGSANEIVVNAQITTSDLVYYTAPSSIETTFGIRNMISVGINEYYTGFIASDFTATIELEITKTTLAGTDSTAFTIPFTVDYKVGENEKHNAVQYLQLGNGLKVKVKVISIDAHGAGWDVTQALIIKNELTAVRDYVFSCSTQITDLQYGLLALNADEVTVSWSDPGNGQTEYDLEWAWVDESAEESYKTEGDFDPQLIFDGNSTRVTIVQNTYNVPLFYDGEGKLFVRVRPVQLKQNGQRIEGAWSWTASGTTGTLVSLDFDGHENDLNWQATTSFAEDGKRKSVVNYFDGSLRQRQVVTKDATTKNVVVAETMYDYQGRAVIQVLPTPTLNTAISYSHNFNQFATTGNYPKSEYDKLNTNELVCNKTASSLSNSSGAAQYYSSSNPFLALSGGDPRKKDFDKFTPDADGYPYTETRFTPDATGRIAAQGGVGPVFQLAAGHETKYYYETPDQAELDGLFGTDAGYASHYTKSTVRDANGQYSVAYVDMHGRTVATALAGDAPANMEQLDGYGSRSVTKNLLGDGSNQVRGRSIVSTQGIVVTKAGDYTFNYSLDPEKLRLDNCSDEEICYDCLYDLKFTIVSECGDLVEIPGQANPYIIHNFSLGEYGTDCGTEHAPGFSTSFTVTLPEGSYQVTKELILSTAAQDYYRDEVFKVQNTCKSLEDFKTETLTLLQEQSNCNLTCESCNAALGTYSSFRSDFLAKAGSELTTGEIAALEPQIQAAYNEAKANCDRLCPDIDDGLESLRSLRKIMLMDVTPFSGQYGKMAAADRMKYNIFYNEANSYEVLAVAGEDWQHPLEWDNVTEMLKPGYYRDENGDIDPVNSELSSISVNDFANRFKESWADALLPHHPEYCKLLKSERFLSQTYQFNAFLLRTETWSAAAAYDFIDGIVEADPFFSGVGAPGAAYKSAMETKVDGGYKQVKSCSVCSPYNASMWQIAQAAILCRSSSSTAMYSCLTALPKTPANRPPGCTADWNYVWKTFLSMYITERNFYISEYLSDCGTLETFSGKYTPRFTPVSSGSAPISGDDDLDAYLDDLVAGNDPTTTAGTVATAQYTTTCNSYAQMWINKLKECPSITVTAGDEEWLLENLVAICVGGSDATHVQGSSSLPSGATAVYDATYGVSYSNFPDVIRQFLLVRKGLPSTTLACNPYMIDFPKPYDLAPAPSNQEVITKPSDCECGQLTTLRSEYSSSGFTGNFSQYLSYQYGTNISMADLDQLAALCNGTSTCNFLDQPIKLPPVLQCRPENAILQTCISCDLYSDIKADFESDFGVAGPVSNPQDASDDEINAAFEDYANYRTGFSKTWQEYVDFGIACANAPTFSCTSLNDIVTSFKATYRDWETYPDCRSLFTQYFNDYFHTFYSYDQIMSLFLHNCGSLPELCRPVIDCSQLKTVLNNFYDRFGNMISQSGNCSALFTAFANQQLTVSYTYSQWQTLYSTSCGCTLDVCSFPNAILLTRVYTAFKSEFTTTDWSSERNCHDLFANYFNEYFGFANGTYNYGDISDFYDGYSGTGCVPDLSGLCDPPFSCTQLQDALDYYNNVYFPSQPYVRPANCWTLYTNFFNDHMGGHFSWGEIYNMYLQCGVTLPNCNTGPCATYKNLIDHFEPEIGGGGPPFDDIPIDGGGSCEEQFVNYFNTELGTSYTYEEIRDLLWKNCGYILNVCDGVRQVTNPGELSDFADRFHSDRVLTAGDPETCQDDLTAAFNYYFGTHYTYEQIRVIYLTYNGTDISIPGSDNLVCDSTDCQKYKAFVIDYTARYAPLKIPLDGRKELFAFLFNSHFGTSLSYDDIETLISPCLGSMEIVDPSTDAMTLYDPDVLWSLKMVYYLLHPGGLPSDCGDDFATWIKGLGLGNKTYSQILDIYDVVTGAGSGDLCGSPLGRVRPSPGGPFSGMPPRLCGSNEPIFEEVPIVEDPCKDLPVYALTLADEQYQLYVDHLNNVFDSAYQAKCLGAKELETFTVSYSSSEYHYTLYYYDQAGNLVRTIPPEGVDDRRDDVPFLGTVATKRANVLAGGDPASNISVPNHRLPTEYRYNSLNQVVQQKTPDAGISKFWYDRLGRLVISQNAKQATNGRYSYTLYDELGRITEVGQKPQGTAMTQATSQNPSLLNSWFTGGSSKEEITRTTYDISYFNGDDLLSPQPLVQRNLRNRVSYTAVYDLEPGGGFAAGDHRAATFYTYDIHGNVDTLLQDYNMGVMADNGNRFKKTAYNFDLVSGKVNEVMYQAGQPDEFYHKYSYDAENRLTEVWTSADGWLWEKDARYEYFKHGPLARTVIGQQQVQGIDYAYTLQGWLKGVNAAAVGDGAYDMGGDGNSSGAHPLVARDAYSFQLNYFTATIGGTGYSDYKPLSGSSPFVSSVFSLTNVDAQTTAKPLFNGNIASMLTNVPKIGDTHLYGYSYDQLNRIKKMDGFSEFDNATNTWTSSPVAMNAYKERVKYDANGNIISYLRHGNDAAIGYAMDSLYYQYERQPITGAMTSNRLRYVYDDIQGNAYTGDIKNQAGAVSLVTVQVDNQGSQSTDNYAYDEIGNLIADKEEGIDAIYWTVYGKIRQIAKSDGTSISYTYDASGNRISKQVGDDSFTWYVRDASGNVMAVYTKTKSQELTQSETHLYGSSRLGIFTVNRNVQNPVSHLDGMYNFERGNKFFELSNHLGNVLATITDRVIQHSAGGTTTDYLTADIASATDYYPFGMGMPGRTYSAGSQYRYGFNGKENDNEAKGDGNQIDYGERVYDPRFGRFLSVDPLQKQFPALSPYQYSGNNPVATIDLDGLEPAAINPGTEGLILILQGVGNDPPDGATQANNAAKTYPGLAPDDALGSIQSSGPSLQVVVYASSRGENTKNDVLETIKNFKSINPNGKIILVGHSQGADNIVELAKENKEVKLDLVITLDIKDASGMGIFSIDDDNIPSNVKNAINYYQENESYGIGGEKIEIDNKEKTNGANILSPGSNHRSIDNDLQPYIIQDINNFLKGKDAVKIAKERQLPTFKPDPNKSPFISLDEKKDKPKSGSSN